jgi:hypothetical protein
LRPKSSDARRCGQCSPITPGAAGGVAKRHEILAEYPYPHRRAVGLGHFLDHARRDPVAADHLSHGRIALDAAQQLVVLMRQHGNASSDFHLAFQHDLAALARRLQDGDTGLERCTRPFPCVNGLACAGDRVAQLVDRLAPRHSRRLDRLELLVVVPVYHDPRGDRPQVRALAGHEHEAEMIVGDGRLFRRAGRTIGTRILERRLCGGRARLAQQRASGTVPRRVLAVTHLAHPPAELVAVEVGIPAVGQRRERTVGEGEKCVVRALRGPRGIPRTGRGAHAVDHPSAEQAHDVHLMRALAEYDAAALGAVELLRPAWTVHEVRVVERRDHAHRAVTAARNERARTQDRAHRSCGWALRSVGTAALVRGANHRVAFRERHGHGLFDETCLPARATVDCVRRVSSCGVAT